MRCYTFFLQHSLLEEIFESYTFSPLRCSLDLLHQCTLAQENQLRYPEEIQRIKNFGFIEMSNSPKPWSSSKFRPRKTQGPQAVLQSTSILGLVHSIRHTANLRAPVKGSKLPYTSDERERYIKHTVDGRNPANKFIPLFTGIYTSQVVQDFFHQQYDNKFLHQQRYIFYQSLSPWIISLQRQEYYILTNHRASSNNASLHTTCPLVRKILPDGWSNCSRLQPHAKSVRAASVV